MLPTHLILTPEARQKILRKLKISWIAYWVVFIGLIVTANMGSQVLATVVTVGWLLVAIKLAMVVAEAASSTGGSGFIWGCGTLFLGPLGALVMPMVQLANLKR